MLDKPWAGWSDIHIGDWTDRCSYIDNVPFMLLEAFTIAISKNSIESVKFDAEGWEYILVLDYSDVHIISDKADDGFIYHSVEIDREELAKELIADIRHNIDDWAEWDDWGSGIAHEDRTWERKKMLSSMCAELEELLSRR